MGRKFALSVAVASMKANDQNFFCSPFAARAVRAAANSDANPRSNIKFCCELYGAVEVIFVSFASSSLRTAFVLCSFALSEWYILTDVPVASSRLRMPLTIAADASLFFSWGSLGRAQLLRPLVNRNVRYRLCRPKI